MTDTSDTAARINLAVQRVSAAFRQVAINLVPYVDRDLSTHRATKRAEARLRLQRELWGVPRPTPADVRDASRVSTHLDAARATGAPADTDDVPYTGVVGPASTLKESDGWQFLGFTTDGPAMAVRTLQTTNLVHHRPGMPPSEDGTVTNVLADVTCPTCLREATPELPEPAPLVHYFAADPDRRRRVSEHSTPGENSTVTVANVTCATCLAMVSRAPLYAGPLSRPYGGSAPLVLPSDEPYWQGAYWSGLAWDHREGPCGDVTCEFCLEATSRLLLSVYGPLDAEEGDLWQFRGTEYRLTGGHWVVNA